MPSDKNRIRTILRIYLLVSLAGALLLSVRAVSSQELPAQGKSIRVQISGLHSDKGQVLCALFPSASAAAFPKKPEASIEQSKSDITNWQALCEFHGIEAGTYAISAIHDENSNGRLDTNLWESQKKAWERRMMLKDILGRLSSTLLPFILTVADLVSRSPSSICTCSN